jgi:uncharacterized protein (TIGR02453 family)
MSHNLFSCFHFLERLTENNNRDWFAQNKKDYDFAFSSFHDFTNNLIASISSFDKSIGTLEAKDCTFRIYRDVRFSHDKSPYKTNMGAYIARGGRKSPFAGYYFHIQPNESFLSGGIYMASPDIMLRIRKDIVSLSDEFKSIVEDADFRNTFSHLGNESLKRVPQGFDSRSVVAEYLKLKHITPHQNINIEDFSNPSLLEKSSMVFKRMYPLISFINRAIETN